MAETALILIDFENEWQDPKSQYYLGDLTSLIKRTNRLIAAARKQNYKIIFIRHVEKDSTKEFASKSKNTEIISSINRKATDLILTKYKISAFYQTSLEQELNGIKNLIITGILTNLCVRSLVQDAYDREFNITIIKDCCTTFTKKLHNFTLQDLKETRPEIELQSLKEFLSK